MPQNIDLVGAFNAGIAARSNVEQLGMMREKRAMLQRDAEAQADQQARMVRARQQFAQDGDVGRLAQVDPKFAQQQADLAKTQAATASTQQEMGTREQEQQKQDLLRFSQFSSKAMKIAQEDRSQYQGLAKMAQTLFPQFADQIPLEAPGDDEIEDSLVMSNTLVDLLDEAAPPSRAAIYAADRLGIRPDEVRDHEEAGKFIEEYYKAELAGKKKPGAQISFEAGAFSPLEKSTKADLEKGLIKEVEILNNIGAVKKRTRGDFLGFAGRAKGALGSLADQLNILPEGSKEYVKARAAWRSEVKQLFDAYRKDITGAAASEKELVRLEDAFLNEKIGRVEFEGRMEQLQEKYTRSIRLKRKYLGMGGIKTAEELNAKVDEAWASGDMANSAEDREARIDELESAGMDQDSIANALLREGYISQQQYDAALTSVDR